MIASSETRHDIAKYYKECFIVCPEYNPKEILQVRNVTNEGIEVINKDMVQGLISFETPYLIKNPLPIRRSWVQYGDVAQYVFRIPQRMWKKGIHVQNTRFNLLTATGLFSLTNFGHSNLEALLNAEYPEELSKEMMDNYKSLALSPLFAMTTKSKDLFLLNKPIGRLSLRGKKGYLLKEFKHISLPPSFYKYNFEFV